MTTEELIKALREKQSRDNRKLLDEAADTISRQKEEIESLKKLFTDAKISLKGRDVDGYENVLLFENFSYDDALIGISNDGRAVYDFDKMVEWLVKTQDFTEEEAIEWIEYNTLRALPYYGSEAPIVMYGLNDG